MSATPQSRDTSSSQQPATGPRAKRAGFIGLGRMGVEMARHLLEAGFPLTIYNRTVDKTRPLAERGAVVAASPRALAERSDVVFTMVADGPALETVTMAPDGVLAGARPGSLLIDSSTVSASSSAKVAAAAQAAGVDFLRAPVTGNNSVAASGTLGVMVSGPRQRYDESLDLFQAFGKQFFYLGPGEEARLMKLALNIMVGVSAAMMAETLVLGEKGGLDWNQMLEILCGSALASPFVKYKAAALATRDFRATFTSKLMRKDLGLALEAARDLGVPLPVAGLVDQLLQGTIGSGYGDIDFASLILMLEAQSGLPAIIHAP